MNNKAQNNKIISNSFGTVSFEKKFNRLDHQTTQSTVHPAYTLYPFGHACGIQKQDLRVLLDSDRHFFSQNTDEILLDPVGHFGNIIAADLISFYRRSNAVKASETSIFYRKATTTLFWSINLASLILAVSMPDTTLFGTMATALLLFITGIIGLSIKAQLELDAENDKETVKAMLKAIDAYSPNLKQKRNNKVHWKLQ